MATDNFWKNNFDATGNCPEAWILTANDLIASSEALLAAYKNVDHNQLGLGDVPPREFGYLGPSLMLKAAAIECLLKAFALRQGETLAREGSLQRSVCGAHDLVCYARKFGFTVSPDEEDVLRRLSLYIPAGRYPTQTKWNTNLVDSGQAGVGMVNSLYWANSDETFVKTIIDRLYATLEQTQLAIECRANRD